MKQSNALKISLLAGLIFFLSACSVTKKTTQTKDKTDTETAASGQEEKSKKTETDKKTKVTKEADELVNIPGSELNGSTSLKDLTAAKPWTLEDMEQKVEIKIDEATGAVSVKAIKKDQKVPVKTKTTTEEELKQTVTEKSDSASESKTSVKTDNTKKDRQVTRTGLPFWLWILIALAVLGALAYRFRKQIPFV